MARAGAGAGPKIREKGGAGNRAENKSFRLRNTNLRYNNLADLAILWSKLAHLGNLAILTLLANLAH